MYNYKYKDVIYLNWYDVMVQFPMVSFPIEPELTDEILGLHGIERFIPEPPPVPVEEIMREQKEKRDTMLKNTDYTQLGDVPLDHDTVLSYRAYRQYLREYTDYEKWWETDPQTYEEWLQGVTDDKEE